MSLSEESRNHLTEKPACFSDRKHDIFALALPLACYVYGCIAFNVGFHFRQPVVVVAGLLVAGMSALFALDACRATMGGTNAGKAGLSTNRCSKEGL